MSRARVLLHFLLLGGVLFAFDRGRSWLGSQPAGAPTSATTAASPAALEDLLVSEALALGIDRSDPVIQRRLSQNSRFIGQQDERLLRQMRASDPVVRRRLVQRMNLLFEADLPIAEPSDEEIAATYRAERDRFRSAERMAVRQIFFDGARGEEAAAAAARRTRAALLDGTVDAERTRLGDPFPDGDWLPSQSRDQLTRRFGEEIAEGVSSLPVGSWSEPLRSPYGIHLLRVEERQPARTLPLDEVREIIRLQRIARFRSAANARATDQLLLAREPEALGRATGDRVVNRPDLSDPSP